MLPKMIGVYIFIAVAFFAFGVSTPASSLLLGTGECTSYLNANGETIVECEGNDFLGKIAGMINPLTTGAYAAAVVASAIFAPQILIYILVAPPLVWIMSLFTMPTALFNAAGIGHAEFPLAGFIEVIIAVLNLTFAVAILTWLKGND